MKAQFINAVFTIIIVLIVLFCCKQCDFFNKKETEKIENHSDIPIRQNDILEKCKVQNIAGTDMQIVIFEYEGMEFMANSKGGILFLTEDENDFN